MGAASHTQQVLGKKANRVVGGFINGLGRAIIEHGLIVEKCKCFHRGDSVNPSNECHNIFRS